MINKLTHVCIMVHDQDAALAFYSKKLGLVIHTDVSMDNFRWLTLSPAGNPSIEISLMRAMTPEQQAVVGKQTPEIPLLSLGTDDCMHTYKMLKENGVEIAKEPTKQPWGTEIVIKDLYGNYIHINQAV